MSQTPDRLTAAFDQVKKDVKMLTSLKTYEKMTQNQIIGGLTVLLLVVGVAAGAYLGQQGQDVRQQASTAYPRCANTTGICANALADGSASCSVGGQNGICSNDTSSTGNCTCVISQPSNRCLTGGATCIGKNENDSCGTAQNPRRCSMINVVTQECTCIDNGPTPTSGQCVPQGGSCNSANYSTGTCCNNSNNVDSLFCYNSSCLACIPDGESVNQQTPIRPGGGSYCCHGVCQRTPVNGLSEFYCCNGGGGTSSPTPTPTQAPGACSSTTVTPDNTCGGGTCGACQRRTGINVSTTTGANCSDICVNDNSCCPNPTTPPNPTNTPRPTNTPVPNTPGQPTNTPVPNATNTPVIAPVCLNVTLNNPASTTPNTPPNIGDAVTLTCSQVSGASRYEFRVKLPNNTYLNVNPSLTTLFVSQQFQITLAGSYNAACRACATVDEASCSPWEN